MHIEVEEEFMNMNDFIVEDHGFPRHNANVTEDFCEVIPKAY